MEGKTTGIENMARTTRLENRDETTRRRNVVTNVKFKRQSVLSSTLELYDWLTLAIPLHLTFLSSKS